MLLGHIYIYYLYLHEILGGKGISSVKKKMLKERTII